MDPRHTILVFGIIACGGHPLPPPAPVSHLSVVLAGPAVASESLRVAATDSFARDLTPRLVTRVLSDRGALDFIDGGGDVLVTDRAAVIRYAAARVDYAVIPMPWDRQYVLVGTTAAAPVDVLGAVRADARPATLHCPDDSARAPAQRVAYPADDSIARSLAERLVGLRAALRAAPVNRGALDGEPAYVMGRPVGDTLCMAGTMHVTPLVETRSQLIVRRGAVGVVADSTGWPRLEIRP